MQSLALPVCRWRVEEVSPGRFGCNSPKLIVSPAGVPPEVCERCYARDHEPAAVTEAVPKPARGVCRHRGEPTRLQECPTCAGLVRLKVHACALHEECTPCKALVGIACCASCEDHEEMAESQACE